MLHPNSNQGFRYMENGRNGMDPSVIPHGMGGPMMPLPFDGSGISAVHTYNQYHAGASSNTLASALASATPENQHLVCKILHCP